MGKSRKTRAKKTTESKRIWTATDNVWHVVRGKLARVTKGRAKTQDKTRLFQIVGEKLPKESLEDVHQDVKQRHLPTEGVYIAHDSMGAPRYIGRGQIFYRLKSHFTRHAKELLYFSFYVVQKKNHEREIETLLIRGAANMLEFNSRKRRLGIAPGNVRDYECGTEFYERQSKKGKKKAKGKERRSVKNATLKVRGRRLKKRVARG